MFNINVSKTCQNVILSNNKNFTSVTQLTLVLLQTNCPSHFSDWLDSALSGASLSLTQRYNIFHCYFIFHLNSFSADALLLLRPLFHITVCLWIRSIERCSVSRSDAPDSAKAGWVIYRTAMSQAAWCSGQHCIKLCNVPDNVEPG